MKYVFALFCLLAWFILAIPLVVTIFPALIIGSETDFFSFPERLINKVLDNGNRN